MTFLPAMTALLVILALLTTACINRMTEPGNLFQGTSPIQPDPLLVPPPSLPVQLSAMEVTGDHRVVFTYYDGAALQTWAIKTISYPETTLKDFPSGSPTVPGHVFVRWIHADTSTDPVSYPEFTPASTVVGEIEVRAYHQALPTLSYDSNGAEGLAPARVSVLKAGEAVRLVGQGSLAAPEGTVFGGWSVREWTGSGFVLTGQYQPGELFQLAASTTLYANWESLP